MPWVNKSLPLSIEVTEVCVYITNLAQQQVDYMEDHVEGELGCEESEEPLWGVHVSLQAHIQEMVVQVWYIFLEQTRWKQEKQ